MKSPHDIAREIVDQNYGLDFVHGLTTNIAAAIEQDRKARSKCCPCGGWILADTDECRVPLCPNCAEEIVRAMGTPAPEQHPKFNPAKVSAVIWDEVTASEIKYGKGAVTPVGHSHLSGSETQAIAIDLEEMATEYAVSSGQLFYSGIQAREDAFKAGYRAASSRSLERVKELERRLIELELENDNLRRAIKNIAENCEAYRKMFTKPWAMGGRNELHSL